MNQALYRKYRSKKLAEIVGQAHITSTLDQALKAGKINHAYLFTGPRGVGKTSIARILAHEINNLPYTDESTHLDIIEIDAASNRRIDEIRDLRDRVHVAPTSAKYKVYIIDEVHMLTKEAFNALLKTLEEPPAHVIFILATTEAHKLPETIISRTQRFHFKSVDTSAVAAHLKEIAGKEGFNIDDDAIELIAEHGHGSFRDSISLLDQVASGQAGRVTAADVRMATGLAPTKLIESLVAAINNQQPKKVLDQLQNASTDGISAKPLAHQMITFLRKSYADEPNLQTLRLMQALLEIESSTLPDIALELVLLQFASAQTSSSATGSKPQRAAASVSTSETESSAPTTTPASAVISATPTSNTELKASKSYPQKATTNAKKTTNNNVETPPAPSEGQTFGQDTWIAILASMKSTNPSLYSVLRMAEPKTNDGSLELHFRHAFHAKRLKETRNIEILSELIKTLLGKPMPISSQHNPDAQPIAVEAVPTTKSKASIESQQEPDADLAAVINTFGGGEVVEA